MQVFGVHDNFSFQSQTTVKHVEEVLKVTRINTQKCQRVHLKRSTEVATVLQL